MIKLNLGCGHNKLEGFVNIDSQGACDPDLVLDLAGERLPFNFGEVDEVVAHHVLEHLHSLKWIMRELYRVMVPEALLRIAVPHPNGDGFWGDPTHRTPITHNTVKLFSKAFCADAREKGWPNTPLADYWGIDFETVDFSFTLTEHWAQQRLSQKNIDHCIRSYSNVVDEMRFTLKRV